MRKLIQEIHNGKNIKENLKHYADIAVKTYVDYGTLEMTFSAYSLLAQEQLAEPCLIRFISSRRF